MKGKNLYDRTELEEALIGAGAPPRLIDQQNLNPAVYLVTAIPLIAPIAWLPWSAANIAWCLLSLLFFALSLLAIIRHAHLPLAGKWIFASLSLAFCPVYVGLLRGNPSVLSISLTVLAVCLSRDNKMWMSGILLGAALCLKPQIALWAVCVLILWSCWQPLRIAFGIGGVIAIAAVVRASHFGRDWRWLQTEWQNLALAFAPGGPSDPGPRSLASFQFLNAQTLTAYFAEDVLLRNLLVWILAASLVVFYLHFRKQTDAASPWRDASFFAALTILITYHRYYDAQLLLLLIPVLVELWRASDRKTAIFLGIFLATIASPEQSVFAKWMGTAAITPSLAQLLLVRNQPLAVLTIALILVFSPLRVRRSAPSSLAAAPL